MMGALSHIVRSSRTLHGIVSWGLLRAKGCSAGYPLFLNTREVTIGTGVKIEYQCRLGGAIEFDDYASIGRGTTMFGDISVGRSTRLNPRCELRGEVSIGRYCAIARNTTFQAREHDQSYAAVQHPLYDRVLDGTPPIDTRGKITVGSDVWIGSDALVLSGVDIGDGAIVAAKSVVNEDVEPYSIVAGVPASHRKYRFPEDVREALLDLRWWEWSESEIRNHAALFARPLRSVSDVMDAVGERSHRTERTNHDRG